MSGWSRVVPDVTRTTARTTDERYNHLITNREAAVVALSTAIRTSRRIPCSATTIGDKLRTACALSAARASATPTIATRRAIDAALSA